MAMVTRMMFSDEELAQEVNSGKDIILEKLFLDGVITKEQCTDYMLYYGFVIGKPSFFSRLWKKLAPKLHADKDCKRYMLVKLLNMEPEKEEPVSGGKT